jgi:hypothetical protein
MLRATTTVVAVASDGIQFIECDNCGLGHPMRRHEKMTPREWAINKGWATDIDGGDYRPEWGSQTCSEVCRDNGQRF